MLIVIVDLYLIKLQINEEGVGVDEEIYRENLQQKDIESSLN